MKRGQRIAVSGHNGYSTYPHLHFEIWGPNTGGELANGVYKYDPYGIYSTDGDVTPYTNNQLGPNHLFTTNPPTHAVFDPPTHFDLTQGTGGWIPGFDALFYDIDPLTVQVQGSNPGIVSPEFVFLDEDRPNLGVDQFQTIKIKAKVEGQNT